MLIFNERRAGSRWMQGCECISKRVGHCNEMKAGWIDALAVMGRSGFLVSSLLWEKGALPLHLSDANCLKRQEQGKPGLLPTQGHHHGEQRRQWECTNRNRTTTTNQPALLWHLPENVTAVQAYTSHARLRQGQRMPVESVELKPSAVA